MARRVQITNARMSSTPKIQVVCATSWGLFIMRESDPFMWLLFLLESDHNLPGRHRRKRFSRLMNRWCYACSCQIWFETQHRQANTKNKNKNKPIKFMVVASFLAALLDKMNIINISNIFKFVKCLLAVGRTIAGGGVPVHRYDFSG